MTHYLLAVCLALWPNNYAYNATLFMQQSEKYTSIHPLHLSAVVLKSYILVHK